MNDIWYFRECRHCGHMENIVGATLDKNGKIIDSELTNSVRVFHKMAHFCRICGCELVDSPFVYTGEEYKEKIWDLRKRRKATLAYQKTLFEKYAANDEAIASKYRLREEIEKEKYKEEMHEKTFPIRIILIGLLVMFLLAPIASYIAFFGVIVFIVIWWANASANGKGSTIIFWDDCNHHHK